MQREIDDLKKKLRQHNENEPHPALTFPPMTTKMLVTDNDQELHLVNLIPVRRNILIRGGEGVHLGEK